MPSEHWWTEQARLADASLAADRAQAVEQIFSRCSDAEVIDLINRLTVGLRARLTHFLTTPRCGS